MVIDGREISESDLVSPQSSFMKKHNNIYITEEQIEILKKYDILIDNYQNYSELIYDIEEYLNDSLVELDDLEWVSQILSEYKYYYNTNK